MADYLVPMLEAHFDVAINRRIQLVAIDKELGDQLDARREQQSSDTEK